MADVGLDLAQKLEGAIADFNLLEHPWYLRWPAGRLLPGELARYAGQYRHLVRTIADCSLELAAWAREALGEEPGLVRELELHGREEQEHVGLWERFAEATGAGEEEPWPATVACARRWRAGAEPAGLLGALYGVESSQPAVAATKAKALVDRYGFQDDGRLAYFRVHAVLDREHAALLRRALARHLGSLPQERRPAAAEAAAAAARAALVANWQLLDRFEELAAAGA